MNAYIKGYLDGFTAKIQMEEIAKDRKKSEASEGMTEGERVDCVNKILYALSKAQISPERGSWVWLIV